VAVRPAPFRSGRMTSCCWPIGEPGTKNFHFCDAEAMAGKPYCAAHAQLAYVKVRDRRDEAAA
jgi:GcrA cell cycle regulator